MEPMGDTCGVKNVAAFEGNAWTVGGDGIETDRAIQILRHWKFACHASPIQILGTVLGSREEDYRIDNGFSVVGDLSCPLSVFREIDWKSEKGRYELCVKVLTTADVMSCVLHKGVAVSQWNDSIFQRLRAVAADEMYVGSMTCGAMKAQRADLQGVVCMGHRALRAVFQSGNKIDEVLEECVREVWEIDARTPFWEMVEDAIYRGGIAYEIVKKEVGSVVLNRVVGVRMVDRDKTLLIYLLLFAEGYTIWQTTPSGTPPPLLRLIRRVAAHFRDGAHQPQ